MIPKARWVGLIVGLCIMFLPALVLASTVQLPQTGQTKCYDSTGTEIACTGTRQDGDIKAGVAWPDPRFTDNTNGTITDNLSGLMWTKDAGTPNVGGCTGGLLTWSSALNYVSCLNSNNYLGHNDWRLPNVNEFESLLNAGESNSATWLAGQGFTNVYSSYWSATTAAPYLGSAWYIYLSYGNIYYTTKTSSYGYAWPVR